MQLILSRCEQGKPEKCKDTVTVSEHGCHVLASSMTTNHQSLLHQTLWWWHCSAWKRKNPQANKSERDTGMKVRGGVSARLLRAVFTWLWNVAIQTHDAFHRAADSLTVTPVITVTNALAGIVLDHFLLLLQFKPKCAFSNAWGDKLTLDEWQLIPQ